MSTVETGWFKESLFFFLFRIVLTCVLRFMRSYFFLPGRGGGILMYLSLSLSCLPVSPTVCGWGSGSFLRLRRFSLRFLRLRRTFLAFLRTFSNFLSVPPWQRTRFLWVNHLISFCSGPSAAPPQRLSISTFFRRKLLSVLCLLFRLV